MRSIEAMYDLSKQCIALPLSAEVGTIPSEPLNKGGIAPAAAMGNVARRAVASWPRFNNHSTMHRGNTDLM